MAVDLSAVVKFPYHHKVTLSGTNGRLTRVVLPTGARCRVSFHPLTTNAALIIDDAVVDDAAVTVSDYPPLNHSQWTGEVKFGSVRNSGRSTQAAFGLVSSTNTQVVWLLLDLEDA